MVAVRNSSPSRPEPCEGNLVAAAIGCGRVDGKTSVAPAGNKSLRLSQASHVKYDILSTYLDSVLLNALNKNKIKSSKLTAGCREVLKSIPDAARLLRLNQKCILHFIKDAVATLQSVPKIIRCLIKCSKITIS